MPLTHPLALLIVSDLVDTYQFDDQSEHVEDEDLQMQTPVKKEIVQWGSYDDDGAVKLTLSRWDDSSESRWVMYIELEVLETGVAISVEFVSDPIRASQILFDERFEVTSDDDWTSVLDEVVLEQINHGLEIAEQEEKALSDDDTDSEGGMSS